MGKVRPSTPLARADRWFERFEARLSALERRGNPVDPSVGRGVIGYDDRSTTATTSGAAVLDVLTCVVDVEANRRLLVGVKGVISQSGSGEIFIGYLREGAGAEIDRFWNVNNPNTTFFNGTGWVSLPLEGGSPLSAGSHTLNFSIARITGSGTCSANGSASGRVSMVVIDVGPA